VAVVSTSEVSELQDVLESLVIDNRLRKALLVLKKELINVQLQSGSCLGIDSEAPSTHHRPPHPAMRHRQRRQ
jgi:Lon-like ATP-dependent protease